MIKKLFGAMITIYSLILVTRSWLYMQLIKYCDQLTSTQLNHFGMLLGNYFTNKGVAILVTVLILTFIAGINKRAEVSRSSILRRRTASSLNPSSLRMQHLHRSGPGSDGIFKPRIFDPPF